ncbi:protein SOB FIVE-LIKE 5-like [Corylus avellana]|uniref:protein SOB FIVE-LIKE 5-like n=1 Tax=Corylus avellana TaxID=13451 RepID=UPI00286B9CB5|nr:protein SOB FIVE-LIKE 5-like [Corylus avellana]
MDIPAASQWSSGCESGWTRYLEQSSLSENQFQRVGGTDDYGGKEARVGEKEEDLSLVSDASSGPSHHHEDDEECFHDNGCHFNYSEVAGKSKKKKKTKELHARNRRHSDLDDTASYPALSFPLQPDRTTLYRNQDSMENLLNFSHGFSATHFEGKSALQKRFSFFESSFAENPPSEEAGGFHGRNWK